MYTHEGEAKAASFLRGVDAFELEHDRGTPVFLFRLGPGELVDAAGAPLGPERLSTLETCVRTEPGCNSPCTLSGPNIPHALAESDSCPIGQDHASAVLGADGGCVGDARGRLCPPGAVEDTLARVRAEVRIRLPGARPSAASPPSDLSGLVIDATYPGDPAEPIYQWTSGHGLVFGVGDRAAIAFDPATGNLRTARYSTLGGRAFAASAVPEGFVVSTREPRPWAASFAEYWLFERTADGQILPPVRLDWTTSNQAESMVEHEGETWLVGGVRVLTSKEPVLDRCTVTGDCREIPLERCPSGVAASPASRLAVGSSQGPEPENGLMLSSHLVHSGPMDGSEPWGCHPAEPELEVNGATEKVDVLQDVWARSDGLYFCASLEIPACSASRPVVLTSSTVSPPRYRFAFEGPAGSTCRTLHPIPGRTDGIWARFDQRVFELAPGVEPREVGPVNLAWGAVEAATITARLSDGRPLLLGHGNRAHLPTETDPVQIIGSRTLDLPDWQDALPNDEGGFWGLSAWRGVFRVGEEGLPSNPVALPQDWGAALGFAREPGADRALVVFERGMQLRTGDFSELEAGVSLPSDFGRPKLVASMGPAGFLVLDNRSQVLRYHAGGVEMVAPSFDDPTTPEIELGPAPVDGACGGTEAPDIWRGLKGAYGAAWAVGTGGVVMRFTALGGVRRRLPVAADFGALWVGEAHELRIAGRGLPPDGTDTSVQLVQVWSLDLGAGWSAPAVRLHDPYISSTGVGALIYGWPIDLLGPESGGATPLLTDSGYLARLEGDERFVYRRSPFNPRGVTVAKDGLLLFWGEGARLSLGRP